MDPRNIPVFYSIMQFLRSNPSVLEVKVTMEIDAAAVRDIQNILVVEPIFRSFCILPTENEGVTVTRVDHGGNVPFSFATEASLRNVYRIALGATSESIEPSVSRPIALSLVNWNIWLTRRHNTVEKYIPPPANYQRSFTLERSKLPTEYWSNEIAKALTDETSVSIICGGPDSCKRTEVVHHLLEQQRVCRAICVLQEEVEVLAAANRICEERNESVGNTVGYKLLINSQISEASNVVFCTVQTLILSLLSDAGQRILAELTQLIVDGVEQRSGRMNLLLTLLKEKIASNPTVKLLLLSNSSEVNALTQFFKGSPVLHVPLQSPKVQFLPNQPHGVQYHYLETILPNISSHAAIQKMREVISSAPELLKLCAKLHIFYGGKGPVNHNVARLMDALLQHCWFAEDARAFDELLQLLERNKHMVDYPHSDTRMTPLMIAAAKGFVGVVKTLLGMGANPCVVGRRSLNAMDWCAEQEQNECWQLMQAAILEDIQETSVVDRMCQVYHKLQNPCVVDQQLVLDVVVHICTNNTPGKILVLLPDFTDVLECYELLRRNPIKRKLNFLICHRHITEEEFKESVASSQRTSLFEIILMAGPMFDMLPLVCTIDYVVDVGLQAYPSNEYAKGLCLDRSCYAPAETTRFLMWLAQRKCFFLYSKTRCVTQGTAASTVTVQPEVMLQALLCRFKSSCPSVELFFDAALMPASPTDIKHSLDVLGHMGAIERGPRTPTKLGALLVNLGIDLHLGKALMYAALCKCLDPMITIVAALKVGNPFREPLDEQGEADIMNAKMALHSRTYSDCMVLLRVYQQWSSCKMLQTDRAIVEKYHLKIGSMEAISNARVELMSVLRVLGIVKCGRMKNNNELNVNSRNWSLVKGCLAAGLYPQLAVADYAKECVTGSSGTEVFEPHPLSVAKVSELPAKWVVYARKVGNPLSIPGGVGVPTVQIVENTVISDWTVLLMCGVDRFETLETGGIQLRTPRSSDTSVPVDFIVDRKYAFQLPQEQYQVVCWLRHKLGLLFRRFADNPSEVLTHADTNSLVLQIGDILDKEDRILMLTNVTGIEATPKIRNTLPMGVYWNYNATEKANV
uniref:Helicase-associated domain-containing protein n=1 Tax=Anopheles dirus TaxID=7168 RepID=A0A182NUA0_9DIPT